MTYLETQGGKPLRGSLRVQGAKNSVLPLLAATLLTQGQTVLKNCPHLRDVEETIGILEELGCRVYWKNEDLYIDTRPLSRHQIGRERMHAMRSSIIFLGALLARCGRGEMSVPGGCALGARPIDIHLWALEKLGARIDGFGGTLRAQAPNHVGAELILPIPSVGATENILLFATSCVGKTTIVNAAREPEITELAAFLNLAGYSVEGAGTPVITVEGGRRKNAPQEITYTVMPDRIVAATWLCGVTATGGEITLEGVVPDHMRSLLGTLEEMGAVIHVQEDRITLRSVGRCHALNRGIRTGPHPAFPTDAQPPIMIPAALAQGQTLFEETIFDDRYRHVQELNRMGANIAVSGKYAVVTGVPALKGAVVAACDLRGCAALVLAGLCAQGKTVIKNAGYIERGYEDIVGTLRALGADITGG